MNRSHTFIDDIGCGAILQEAGTDRRAIVIDFTTIGGNPICVSPKAKFYKSGKLPTAPRDYEIFVLGDERWEVVHPGQDDEVLVE